MSKYANINPTTAEEQKSTTDTAGGFAALVRVKTSRFGEFTYNPDSGIASKVGIIWTLESTKGNTFERRWSTGVPYEEGKSKISADGKRFEGKIGRNSDGWYMLTQAVEAGFPSEKLTDDISVFDNEVFFITDQINPKSKGSRSKSYPKYYKGNDWEAAKEDQLRRRAEREAKQGASTQTTMTGSYTPPAVVQADTAVIAAAQTALVDILTTNGRTMSKSQLPSKLNEYRRSKGVGWTDDFHKLVAVALWTDLLTVISGNANIKLENDTLTLR